MIIHSAFGPSVGSANKGIGMIEGNVKEYIDVENENAISNIKIELFDQDENEIQLYDNSGKEIDGIYSDENGNYQINGIETAQIRINEKGEFVTDSISYIVQFTYGSEEQLRINPKYNGQDYESKKDDRNIEVKIEEKDTLKQIEEVKNKEEEIEKEYYKEGQKIDVYFILDCSGSMKTVVEQSKEGLKNVANKIFERYGDNARIGLITYGGIEREEKKAINWNIKSENEYRNVEKEFELVAQDEYNKKIEETLQDLDASGANYNPKAIDLARDAIISEGRKDSEKYIILIGDGVAFNREEEFNETKEAYEKACNEEIKMFSLLVGDKEIIKRYWEKILYSLAETDWYYSEDENTSEVLEFITYQYILGNREFINNKEYITENGEKDGNVGTEVKLSNGKASIVSDDEERRKEVNRYTSCIDNSLRN